MCVYKKGMKCAYRKGKIKQRNKSISKSLQAIVMQRYDCERSQSKQAEAFRNIRTYIHMRTHNNCTKVKSEMKYKTQREFHEILNKKKKKIE